MYVDPTPAFPAALWLIGIAVALVATLAVQWKVKKWRHAMLWTAIAGGLVLAWGSCAQCVGEYICK